MLHEFCPGTQHSLTKGLSADSVIEWRLGTCFNCSRNQNTISYVCIVWTESIFYSDRTHFIIRGPNVPILQVIWALSLSAPQCISSITYGSIVWRYFASRESSKPTPFNTGGEKIENIRFLMNNASSQYKCRKIVLNNHFK